VQEDVKEAVGLSILPKVLDHLTDTATPDTTPTSKQAAAAAASAEAALLTPATFKSWPHTCHG
jgi:hypothetical protein